MLAAHCCAWETVVLYQDEMLAAVAGMVLPLKACTTLVAAAKDCCTWPTAFEISSLMVTTDWLVVAAMALSAGPLTPAAVARLASSWFILSIAVGLSDFARFTPAAVARSFTACEDTCRFWTKYEVLSFQFRICCQVSWIFSLRAATAWVTDPDTIMFDTGSLPVSLTRCSSAKLVFIAMIFSLKPASPAWSGPPIRMAGLLRVGASASMFCLMPAVADFHAWKAATLAAPTAVMARMNGLKSSERSAARKDSTAPAPVWKPRTIMAKAGFIQAKIGPRAPSLARIAVMPSRNAVGAK